MKQIGQRFYTDIGEFTGEGIDVDRREIRETNHLLSPGTIVKVCSLDQSIKIISVLQVYNRVLYDYKGLLETEKGLEVVYFNHNIVTEHHTESVQHKRE